MLPRWSGIVSLFVENPLIATTCQATKRNVITRNCVSLVRGRGVVFRHYYKSIAKWAGKDYRDGAVVPFE